MAGLCVSLYVRPRRLFVRLKDGEAVVGGLDRTDVATGLTDEVAQLSDAVAGSPSGDGAHLGGPQTSGTMGATDDADTKGTDA